MPTRRIQRFLFDGRTGLGGMATLVVAMSVSRRHAHASVGMAPTKIATVEKEKL